MNGIITNIQRFSLSDGDGIRTTVFFKGCNMKCEWCHNPETINLKRELMFYKNKCIGCGKCFEVCPRGTHKMIDGAHIIDREACVSCGKCSEVCYAEALTMCGTQKTVDEVMKELRQDKEYYQSSGGGITLSGGEVLCQRDFAIEICKACKEEEISTALETNLCFDFDFAKELLKCVDLIMCDIKIFDDDEHIKHTGVSNKLILGNIKRLDELGIPVIVRTPLIPDVTDTETNISEIVNYIKELKNLRRYELLSFNPLGEGKYKGLDRENIFEKCKGTSEIKLEQLSGVVKEAGIAYKIV